MSAAGAAVGRADWAPEIDRNRGTTLAVEMALSWRILCCGQLEVEWVATVDVTLVELLSSNGDLGHGETAFN
ncbi:hypothetical protein F0562_024039 [Nyssa sinensis]|uniref:Uncharacterized protein n=1 Tax=Nyssa sinensis TaxID=561372 RepID=A0A5J5BM37_9ASTE|nr:hypothetical protein F0562_024039 [Nyssa sinensis]